MTTHVTEKPTRKSRNPAGNYSDRRLGITITPEERVELIRRAGLDNRTFSAMARVYMIQGMKADHRFDQEDK
jgi:hypothetical protein